MIRDTKAHSPGARPAFEMNTLGVPRAGHPAVDPVQGDDGKIAARDGALAIDVGAGSPVSDASAPRRRSGRLKIQHPPSRLENDRRQASTGAVGARRGRRERFRRALEAARGAAVHRPRAQATATRSSSAPTKEAELACLATLKASLKSERRAVGDLAEVPARNPERAVMAAGKRGRAVGREGGQLPRRRHTAEKFVIPVNQRRVR